MQTHADGHCKMLFGYGRVHYIIGNASQTLCFWPLEPRKFKRRVENIAEVDATGRYILSRLACRRQSLPSRTLLWA